MSEAIVIIGRIKHTSQVMLIFLLGLIILITYGSWFRDWLHARNK